MIELFGKTVNGLCRYLFYQKKLHYRCLHYLFGPYQKSVIGLFGKIVNDLCRCLFSQKSFIIDTYWQKAQSQVFDRVHYRKSPKYSSKLLLKICKISSKILFLRAIFFPALKGDSFLKGQLTSQYSEAPCTRLFRYCLPENKYQAHS